MIRHKIIQKGNRMENLTTLEASISFPTRIAQSRITFALLDFQ